MSRKQNLSRTTRRGVIQAYAHFLMDVRESSKLKLVPLIMMGYIPLDGLEAVLGDILAPFTAGATPVIASLDDIPVGIVVFVAACKMIGRIKGHMSYEQYPDYATPRPQFDDLQREPYPNTDARFQGDGRWGGQ